MFHPDYIHSVRDAYTEKFLHKIGITNVVNTGCPTMWGLLPEHCAAIPQKKADTVILTLTDYSQDVARDELLIKTLNEHYRSVYYWIQGANDYAYFKTLRGVENIKIIPPNLAAYDTFLKEHETDFVGTRLHGGMRALQNKRRTIIIGIDNRAIELNRDFNIPVLNQNNMEQLSGMIEQPLITAIRLNTKNIALFLRQFNIKYEGEK